MILSLFLPCHTGCPFNPLVKVNNAVANVIGSLVFGHRYEYDDVDFQKRLQMSAESVFLTGSVWNQVLKIQHLKQHLKMFTHNTCV